MQHIFEKHQVLTQGFNNQVNHSYEARRKNLLALRNLILENENQILEALKKDLGKSDFEASVSETLFVIKEIDHALKKLKKWMKKKRVKSPWLQFPARSYILPEPLGTVLIISPWNYPFQLLVSPLVGALAAGNTALLKPSEIAPNVSKAVSELIPRYFDQAVVSVVEGGIEETQAVLDLPFQHIFYTGNGFVGRIVMEKASKYLCPVTLELGGKSPCYVDENNDLELVARRIVWGKFFNAGQTCVAPDYILSTERVGELLVKGMQKAMKEFFPNGPKESPDYGRIVNERHFKRLEGYLADSRDEVVIGGERVLEERFFAPTVLKSSPGSKVMEEEIFGPILPMISIADLESAISFIKERPHPLAAYAFSKDDKVLANFEERVTSGGMCLNDSLVHLSSDTLPFGGVGESGMGSYHGRRSFEIFSHFKSVMRRGFLDLPMRYPPYEGKLGLVRRLFSWL